MAPRYLTGDFQFPREFGFTKSAEGRDDARNHPADADDNEYGDGSYVERPPALAKEKAKGGPIRRAQGGETLNRTMSREYRPDSDSTDWPGSPPSSDSSDIRTFNQPKRRIEVPASSDDIDPRLRAAQDAVNSGNYRRGGRATGKPSTSHANDPQGYAMGGPADGMPTGRPTGVPMGAAAPPGVGPAAGPMAQAPAPMGPRPSPLAQGQQSSPLANATMTMPVHDAARLAHGLVQAGRVGGIRQAMANSASARGAAQQRMAAMSPGAAGAPAAAPPAPVAQQGVPAMKSGGHITAAQRHRLPASEFGLPSREGYPIDTPGRARSALSRASANASPAEQAEIRRKVHARYPSIGKK